MGYCGPWGECIICDAARTSERGWVAVAGFESSVQRVVTEESRMFWVRRHGKTQRIRGYAYRDREVPFTDPLTITK